MPDSVFFFLNGRPVSAAGPLAFENLAEFLRRERGLTGTKIACAQGACGACSVLVGRPDGDALTYATLNSCLPSVFQMHGTHVVTVEGLSLPNGALTPIQNALVEHHGAQCGFCTAGFVVSLTLCGESEVPPREKDELKRMLCGNLCRCTGYEAILESAQNVDWDAHRNLTALYPPVEILSSLGEATSESVLIEGEKSVFLPANLEDALARKLEHPGVAPIAGGTEWAGLLNSPSDAYDAPRQWLSLSNLTELREISVDNGVLILGAGASWTAVKEATAKVFPEFSEFLEQWGSPQLRNAGTVGGSVVRASAIADSLPLFMVCEAQVELVWTSGTRRIGVQEFLSGDKPDLHGGELLYRVHVPLPSACDAKVKLFKISHRQAFDRSIISAAFWHEPLKRQIRIAFGGVASKVLRLEQTEIFLNEYDWNFFPPEIDWKRATDIAQSEIDPVSDGSTGSDYRRRLVTNLLTTWGREVSK